MNCPRCQKELPADYSANYCFACGGSLSPEEYRGPDGELKHLPAVKFRAPLFFLLLLGPAVITMISAWLVGGSNESVSPFVGLIGGGTSGIACGLMLGRRIPSTGPVRIILCLFYSGIMTVVCIMLCFFGCNLGGYDFQLH
jgi:hypothetical protein